MQSKPLPGFDPSIQVYSTCPASIEADGKSYRHLVQNVVRWSEDYGCEGILVYSDNRLVDAWALAQLIVDETERLSPLVAVQPVYMHPYAVAKKLATFAYLSNRRVCLNLVAGGFRNDLVALGDETPHDRRYDRLREYIGIIGALLSGEGPVSFSGNYYRVSNLRLTPPLSRDLMPEIFISGSSPAGRDVAREVGALAVRYPAPEEAEPNSEQPDPGSPRKRTFAWGQGSSLRQGVRLGVIARPGRLEAWRVAHERFPPDRRGQLTHNLAAKVTDSSWYKKLTTLASQRGRRESLYWLEPFATYQTMCPYLVGSYEEVGDELARYRAQGCNAFILDIPGEEEDLYHTTLAFRRAVEMTTV